MKTTSPILFISDGFTSGALSDWRFSWIGSLIGEVAKLNKNVTWMATQETGPTPLDEVSKGIIFIRPLPDWSWRYLPRLLPLIWQAREGVIHIFSSRSSPHLLSIVRFLPLLAASLNPRKVVVTLLDDHRKRNSLFLDPSLSVVTAPDPSWLPKSKYSFLPFGWIPDLNSHLRGQESNSETSKVLFSHEAFFHTYGLPEIFDSRLNSRVDEICSQARKLPEDWLWRWYTPQHKKISSASKRHVLERLTKNEMAHRVQFTPLPSLPLFLNQVKRSRHYLPFQHKVESIEDFVIAQSGKPQSNAQGQTSQGDQFLNHLMRLYESR